MNDAPFSISVGQNRRRLVVMVLMTVWVAWPMVAWGQCMMQLKGKAYVSLPQGVCPRYTDMLLRQTQQKDQKFSGVICDRPEGSYILLQKLLKYTDQGKAVWEVLQVQKISRPTPQSFVKGIGCQLHIPGQSKNTEPIFALVQPSPNNTYLTLAAWRVDLIESSFKALESQNVICQDEFL